MPRLRHAGTLGALLCATLTLTALAPASHATALLDLHAPEVDFGTIQDDTPIVRQFRIANTGDSPLTIRGVRPACPDCTRCALSQDVLPPGAAATLTVTLDPASLEGDVEKSITLETDAPASPLAMIVLRGTVSPRFRRVPNKVVLELADTNAVGEARVVLAPQRPLRLPLAFAESDSPYLAGEVLPNADGSFTLRAFTRPPLPAGALQAEFRVFSADTNDPVCRVSAVVGVWPGFLAVPDRLRFAANTPHQRRILFLRQFPDTPHRITGARASLPDLRLELYPEPAGCNYRLYADVQAPVAATNATLTIATDDPDQPAFDVPVRFEP